MKKKILLLVVALLMHTTGVSYASPFTDMPEDTMVANAIEELWNKGVIEGTSQTTYSPDNNVTRAEFCALVSRAMNYSTVSYRGTFTDVSDNEWHCNYIQTLYDKGIINGVSHTEFAPNDFITREQGAKILVGIFENTCGTLYWKGSNQITAALDYQQISEWAIDSMWQAQMLGFLPRIYTEPEYAGWTYGKYYVEPQKMLTRAETAEIIYNLLNAVSNITAAMEE